MDCPGDTVHTVHYPSICSQDDRKRKVNFLDESKMFDDPSNGWGRTEPEPEVSVNIGDRFQGNGPDRQIDARLDEVVHVPCVEAVTARSEVVLLAHLPSVSQICGLPQTPVGGGMLRVNIAAIIAE